MPCGSTVRLSGSCTSGATAAPLHSVELEAQHMTISSCVVGTVRSCSNVHHAHHSAEAQSAEALLYTQAAPRARNSSQ